MNDESAMAALYRDAYPRLVAVVGAIHRDRGEAEEAVQDAFVRLIGRWDAVSRYDDPEAWVRRVALGYASNRRHRLRNGLRVLARLGHPDATHQDPSGELDIESGIARLPRHHREVVVLRHLGLDLEAIAETLDVPVGTVKSRLSRARTALHATLGEDLTTHG